MWRCEYCRKTFDDRDDSINHARAQHSRDYTACRYVPAAQEGRVARALRGRWWTRQGVHLAWRWGHAHRTGDGAT